MIAMASSPSATLAPDGLERALLVERGDATDERRRVEAGPGLHERLLERWLGLRRRRLDADAGAELQQVAAADEAPPAHRRVVVVVEEVLEDQRGAAGGPVHVARLVLGQD